MSKQTQITIGLISLTVILAGAGLILKQKTEKKTAVEKEISIKQAELAPERDQKYEDEAGFSFEYPAKLKVTEIELDNDQVYSSLEIKDETNQGLNLRIADTRTKNLKDWMREFEKLNVILEENDVFWVDIKAKQLVYGAPKQLLTVALENGVEYRLSGPADDGYWEKVHEQIWKSFEFDPSVYQGEAQETKTENSEEQSIILLEEKLE